MESRGVFMLFFVVALLLVLVAFDVVALLRERQDA